MNVLSNRRLGRLAVAFVALALAPAPARADVTLVADMRAPFASAQFDGFECADQAGLAHTSGSKDADTVTGVVSASVAASSSTPLGIEEVCAGAGGAARSEVATMVGQLDLTGPGWYDVRVSLHVDEATADVEPALTSNAVTGIASHANASGFVHLSLDVSNGRVAKTGAFRKIVEASTKPYEVTGTSPYSFGYSGLVVLEGAFDVRNYEPFRASIMTTLSLYAATRGSGVTASARAVVERIEVFRTW